MPGQLVELGERTRIEQGVDPLASCHLAFGVLPFDLPGRARMDRLLPALLQIGQLAGGGVQVSGPGIGDLRSGRR